MNLFDGDFDSSLPVQSLEIDKSEPLYTVEEIVPDDRMDDGLLDVSFGCRKTNVKVNNHVKWL